MGFWLWVKYPKIPQGFVRLARLAGQERSHGAQLPPRHPKPHRSPVSLLAGIL